jgi:hypothetical protein
MGEKIAFATASYDLPKPVGSNMTDAEYLNEIVLPQNSCFSGFPHPVPYNGEVWDGTFEDLGGANDPGDDFVLDPGGYIPNYQPKKNNPDSILVGPGTNFVGPFTIQEAVAIFWRTKKWSIAANGQASESFFPTVYRDDSGPPNFTPREWSPFPDPCNGITSSASVGSLNAGETTFYNPGSNTAQKESEIISKEKIVSHNGKSAVGDTSDCFGFYGYAAHANFGVRFSTPSYQLFTNLGGSRVYGPFFNMVMVQGTQDYYIKFDFSVVAYTSNDWPGPAYRYWIGYGNKRVSLSLEKPAGFVSTNYTRAPWSYSREWKDFPQSGDNFVYPDSLEQALHTASSSGVQAILNFTVPSSNRILQVPIYGYSNSWTYGGNYTSGNLVIYTSTSTASIESVDIGPLEYWEYDDGNGNPIYDKDTGEMLRDPVTGEEV